jgi:hypothetical protein
VVKADGSSPRGRGFKTSNPCTVYWMDVSDASYYIKEKSKIRVAKWGTPKNSFKKRSFVIKLSLQDLYTNPSKSKQIK